MTHSNTTVPEVNGFGQTVNFNPVAPNLWFVHDTFDQSTLHWMQGIYVDMNNTFEVTRPDKRLQLADGNDYRKLQDIGVSLVPRLEELLNIKLNLMVAKFWLDLPEFGCQPHGDSKEIIVTLQVYIDAKDGGDPLYGAEFMHVEPSVTAPLLPNCGYLNLNTDQKVHQVEAGIGVRQSIAFQYNLSTDS